MLNKEPAVIVKVLEEIVRAAIPLALIFGWVNWTEAQTGAVMLFIGVFVGGIAVLFTRAQVSSESTVNALIKEAVKSPAGTSPQAVKDAVEAKE